MHISYHQQPQVNLGWPHKLLITVEADNSDYLCESHFVGTTVLFFREVFVQWSVRQEYTFCLLLQWLPSSHKSYHLAFRSGELIATVPEFKEFLARPLQGFKYPHEKCKLWHYYYKSGNNTAYHEHQRYIVFKPTNTKSTLLSKATMHWS